MLQNQEIIKNIQASAVRLTDNDSCIFLDDAKTILEEARKNNINGYVNVQAISGESMKLYSLLDDEDSMSIKITGKSVAQIEEELKELDRRTLRNCQKRVEQHKRIFETYAPKVPEWIERGKEHIFPQRMPDWSRFVIESLASYWPNIIDYALGTMDMIKSGVPYAEIYKSLCESIDPDYIYSVTSTVANYAKEGVEFFKAVDPEHYQYHKKHYDKVEEQNNLYQSSLGE